MSDQTAVIIQARSNSSRLPGKMKMTLDGDLTLFQVILKQVLKAFPAEEVIIATTNTVADDWIEEEGRANGIHVYRGDEHDVLSRFIGAAEMFETQYLLRICADNPLLQAPYLKQLMDQGKASKADYMSFRFADGTPSIKSHVGLFAEYTTLRALKEVRESTSDSFYREHVTNFLYEHPDQFDIQWMPIPEGLVDRKDIRLTIDSPADFEMMQQLYQELSHDQSIANIVKTIDLNPRFMETMKAEIAANSK